MQLNSQQLKVGLGRAILRMMPLILMGILTLITFWLVKKSSAPEGAVLERVRLHEPDYIITDGTLSALSEAGNTKYRVLGKKVTISIEASSS